MQELRVALIGGGGFMGRTHSIAYAIAPLVNDFDIVFRKAVLVDIDDERASTAAAELGWESSSSDWRDVVAREDIDIVDIVTPPHTHAEIARAAIDAGKHVFSEKPLTNDAADAVDLAQRAFTRGVLAQVGFNYRHTSAISFAKQLWESGRLGEPLQFRGEYLMDTGLTVADFGWRANKGTGGSGTLGDIGSHILDIAEYLFGDIVRVFGTLKSSPGGNASWAPDDTRASSGAVDDAATWIAEFANGAIGTFTVSIVATGRKNLIHFQADGTAGAIEFNWNHREELAVSYRSDDVDHSGFRSIVVSNEHPDVWWPVAGIGIGYLESTTVQLQRFGSAILHGQPSRPDFRDGAHVQLVVEAIAASMTTGTWVDIPRLGALRS